MIIHRLNLDNPSVSHFKLNGRPPKTVVRPSLVPSQYPRSSRCFNINFKATTGICDLIYIQTQTNEVGELEKLLGSNFYGPNSSPPPPHPSPPAPLLLRGLCSECGFVILYVSNLRYLMMRCCNLNDYVGGDDGDDDDFLLDDQEVNRTDLVVPFKKSVKQIARESTVITTRRILERISVHYVSQRMAWKLLKDVRQSAVRKAGRNMPTLGYVFCVSRTTFRGHILGVAASWVVQVGIELYRIFTSTFNSVEANNRVKKGRIAGQKVVVATIRCGSSLIFASIGAGIGATLIRPSLGQWIGCAAGDIAGPVIVAFCAEKVFYGKF
ncbi:Protein sym-1 like [Senna tora]|uniref:Protein sym-1 like n=1 Tax=Senna tora TaxID=362788 RepID=A0A834X1C4_9FABA|nr:Protein sym-1 like [Senna tora]